MPEADSTLRLYLASVSGDMDGERAVVEGLVLPELRARAEGLGFAVELVDPIKAKDDDWDLAHRCREIDACRPFFLGFLGERYGDPPLAVSLDVVAAHPWLAEDPGRGLLELEILHGALRDPAAAAGAFFYLRDPRFPLLVPDQHRARFLAESERAAARLAALKESIRESGRPVFDGYPCDWSGSLGRASRLDALAERMVEDLWPAIQEHGPAPASPSPARDFVGAEPAWSLEDTATAMAPPPTTIPAARPMPAAAPTVAAPSPLTLPRSRGRGAGFKAAAVIAMAVAGLSLFALRARFGSGDATSDPPIPSNPRTAQPPSNQGSALPPADHETYDAATWRELTAACELSGEEIAKMPSRSEPGASMIEVYTSPNAYNAQVVKRQLESRGAFVLPRRVEGKAVCSVVLDPWEPASQQYLQESRARGIEPGVVLFPQVPG